MLTQLLINACLFIAFVSMANLFFHERLRIPDPGFLTRLLYGAVFGTLGILLTSFGVPVGVAIIDFRLTQGP